MDKLNSIEDSILVAIIADNIGRYPFLKDHYPFLFVISRETTGVGFYTNFGYATNNLDSSEINTHLTSHKRFIVKDFENELSYELALTNGKIKFLEVVTNGKDTFKQIEELSDFVLA